MAMMATGSGNNTNNHYDPYDNDADLIDPDDASLDDLDPMAASTSDRAPLTGNLQPQQQQQQRIATSQSYLNNAIQGEDRRAPQNTIDESVWATLRRDLLAVGEKMRQVLYPKYLLGGLMERNGGGMSGADGAEGGSAGGLRGLVGRWPGAEVLGDVVLQQGGMSEGLRDWDLWGPLLFCLLLSFFLSRGAQDDQKSLVFSGVFTIVWLGEALVTMQIKLLGGNISFFQSVCIIGYTLFPLVIASILSAVGLPMIARIPVYIVLVLWSLAAGISILGGSGVVKNRVALAMFPLVLYYASIVTLCFIS